MSFEGFEFLLLIAAVVAALARMARLPYTVGLVVAGLLVAATGYGHGLVLSKELIFKAFLPPLIFEAAYQMPWTEVRRELPLASMLATVGVLSSTLVIAVAMHGLSGWAWMSAVTFGILISATDPVSVIATFRELKVEGRLRVLIESESLFNDGTVAAFFGVMITVTSLEALSPTNLALSFFATVFGGVAIGAGVGWGAHFFLKPTEDHLVELLTTVVAAFGSFFLAEHFHCTGVLSTLTAGLALRKYSDRGALSEQGRTAVNVFWEFLAFAANSLVFLLIGVSLGTQDFRLLLPACVAIPVVVVARAISVYGCSVAFLPTRYKLTAGTQHALFWGGLRGALALALSLGLPEDFPQRRAVMAACFAMVAFSVLVQGMTIAPLLRAVGELPKRPDSA